MDMPKPISLLLKYERERAGLLQKDVTEQLGLSPRYISMIERNQRTPSEKILRELAKLYGCPVAAFYDVDYKEIMAVARARLRDYLYAGRVDKSESQRARLIVTLTNTHRNDEGIASENKGSVTSATDLIHILEPADPSVRIRIPLKDDFIPIFEGSTENVRNFTTSQSKEILVYGARSCGKTARILLLLLWYCENVPNIKIAICRSEESGIGKTILASFKLLFKFPYPKDPRNPFKIIGGMDKPSGIRFNNGAEIMFVGLRDEDRLRGLQSHIVFLNQGENEDSIDTFSSLGAGAVGERAGPIDLPPGQDWSFRMYVDANPDIPLHWLYKRSQTDVMETYHFTHKDHPHYWDPETEEYTEKGIEVRNDIKELYPPGHMRDRMLDGLWAGAIGLVLNCFDPEKHVLPLEKQPEIQSDWHHYRSTDWAYGGAHITLWISTDPSNGKSYVWQEYAKTGSRNAEHAEFTKLHSREFNYKVHYADSEDASARADYNNMGIPTRTVDKDMRPGINVLNTLFAEDKLYIFEGLNINRDQELINKGYPADTLAELAQLRYPEKQTGTPSHDNQPDKHCYKDRFDALRYWAVGTHGIPKRFYLPMST